VPGFSESVTLGEFIRRAKELGVQLRHSPSLAEGPKGLAVTTGHSSSFRTCATIDVSSPRQTLDLPKEDFGL